MEISAIASQATPKDPATVLGEDPALTGGGGFAALLASSARHLGQSGVQAMSVNSLALIRNIQVVPPAADPQPAQVAPPPPPSAADNSGSDDRPATPANAMPVTAETAPTAKPTTPAVRHQAAQKSNAHKQADHTAAAKGSDGRQSVNASDQATGDASDQQTVADDQQAASADPAQAAIAANTLDNKAAADRKVIQAATADIPTPASDAPVTMATPEVDTAPITQAATKAADDLAAKAAAKAAPTHQDKSETTAAAPVDPNAQVALAALAQVVPADQAPKPAATPQLKAARQTDDGDDQLLGLANAGRRHGGADRQAGAEPVKSAAAQTTPRGATTPTPAATADAASDAATTDPSAAADSRPTGSAALQAQALGQIAGETRVQITQSSTSPATGLAPQSTSGLVPGAFFADPSGANDRQAGGQPFSQQLAQQFGQSSAATPQQQTVTPTPAGTAFAITPQLPDLGDQAPVAGASILAGQAIAGTPGDADGAARIAVNALDQAAGPTGTTANAPPTPLSGTATGPAPTQRSADAAPAAAAKPASPPELPTPIEQLKVQIEKGVKAGADTISVQLHPDDLGRVEVKLEVQDGQVKATVTADRPETLQLLKSDAGGLQQALHDAGLSSDPSAMSFLLRGDQQQRQAGQNPGRSNGNRRIQEVSLAPDDTAGPLSTAIRPRLQSAGGVDISV